MRSKCQNKSLLCKTVFLWVYSAGPAWIRFFKKQGLQISGKSDQRDERCHQEQQAGAAGAGAVAVVALTAAKFYSEDPGHLWIVGFCADTC